MTSVAPVLIAGACAYGVFLIVTATLFGWRGLALSPLPPGAQKGQFSRRARGWLDGAGLEGVGVSAFALVMASVVIASAGTTFVLFGALLPALAVGAFAGTFPAGALRARRADRRRRALEAWPRMLEEVALLAGSLGRSIPQALFEVGEGSGPDMRPAFAAAQRHWRVSTDFGASLGVLKAALADPTTDAACETLRVAHEVGGTDVASRLAALVEDRRADLQGRKDAWAKQAGVRFARRFVLLVPFGMALSGLAIGNGRAAYRSPTGQLVALLGVGLVAACWAWAGRIMRLPEERRVFSG